MEHYPIRQKTAFSLVEVVIALGVIAFAIVAILGVLPIGLKTGHSAQDQTRAGQIAQDILSSLASQAQTQYPNLVIRQTSTGFNYNISLATAFQYNTLAADNDGRLVSTNSSFEVLKFPYQVLVQVNPSPAGFDAGYAAQVTVRVLSPPSANPNGTPNAGQAVNDYVRIISKY